MRDTTVNQVPEACAKLYRCGLAAMEKNEVDPAIASFTTALEIDPGFVACREALRSAQKKAAEKRPGFWERMARKGRLSPSLAEAEVLLHLQPLKAMSIAERVLNQEPENITAHRLIAKAALALDLPRTALLSLEMLAGEHPDHRALKLAMGDALARSGDPSAAAALYGRLLKDNPRDGTVLRALRKLPARFVEEQANNLSIGGSFAPILPPPASTSLSRLPATTTPSSTASSCCCSTAPGTQKSSRRWPRPMRAKCFLTNPCPITGAP